MRKLFGILAAAALVVATSASAAPVVRPANFIISIAIQGLAPITLTGSGNATVDSATSGIALAAAAISLTADVVVPVTATTVVKQVTAKKGIANKAGTFREFLASSGGVTTQLPGELCGGGGKGPGKACNEGGGLGGKMGITGTVNVSVIPGVVVIPVNLNAAKIGQGGATNAPFTIDAAGWSTGDGVVQLPNGVLITQAGATGGNTITLVTPTFVSALGNLLPIFTSLTITFTDGLGLPAFVTSPHVPEPGTLLLLGSGIAGLLLLGRRRE